MAEYQRRLTDDEKPFEAALLVCGRREKYQMNEEVMEMIAGLEGAPVMLVGHSTHEAIKMIHDYTPKFTNADYNRVQKAVEHYEPYIEFEEILRRTSNNANSQ